MHEQLTHAVSMQDMDLPCVLVSRSEAQIRAPFIRNGLWK